MKITIYELLGMIKDGNAPRKIMYLCDIYELHIINEYTYYKNGTTPLLISTNSLNDTVEILEEEKKIPEKLKWNEKSQHNVVTDNTKKTLENLLSRSEQLKKSINEIIDYLKSKGE